LVKFDENGSAFPSPNDWSTDGPFVIHTVNVPRTKRDLSFLTMDGERKPTKFLQTEFSESDAKFSPGPQGSPHDVEYVSDESGKEEIYVTTFPDPKGGKWPI